MRMLFERFVIQLVFLVSYMFYVTTALELAFVFVIVKDINRSIVAVTKTLLKQFTDHI